MRSGCQGRFVHSGLDGMGGGRRMAWDGAGWTCDEEDAMVDWEPEHVDWAPLQAVLSEDALADWMWMYATLAEDGTCVHCYKHVWTRRHIQLDALGRVYAEGPDGTPRRLPGCGGATLLLSLVATTAICDVSVGPVIRVPEGAQEPTTMDDLPAFLELLWAIASDVGGVLEALDRSAAKVGSR